MMPYQAVPPPNYAAPLVDFMGPARAMQNAIGQQRQRQNAQPGQPQTTPTAPSVVGPPMNLLPAQAGRPMGILPQWAAPFQRFTGQGGPLTGTSPQAPVTQGYNPQVPSGWAGLY